MILPVFVINMASQPAAYKTVAASIEAYGQGFQLHRIDAVNGHTATQRIGIDDARFDAINGREMLPGEYGCYRSHLKALESFLSDGSPTASFWKMMWFLLKLHRRAFMTSLKACLISTS